MAGLIGAFLFADEDARRKLGRLPIANALFWSGAILFVALTGFVIQLEGDIGFFAIGLLTPLLSVAFAFMMLGLLGGCTGHNIFAVRPLRFIALISYSLYLIHTALILPCIEAVFRIIPESHPLLAWAVFLIPFLFLSVALSTVSYFAVEKPFIDWSKRSVPAGW
jgi:peptidoglycan/LPS O-acetylase OafA/YrhL